MVEMDYQDLPVHLGKQALPVSLLWNWLNVELCCLCNDYNKVCSASLDDKTLWSQSRLCRDNKYMKGKYQFNNNNHNKIYLFLTS